MRKRKTYENSYTSYQKSISSSIRESEKQKNTKKAAAIRIPKNTKRFPNTRNVSFFLPATWRCFPQQKKGADLGGLLGTLLQFLLRFLLAFWSFFHASEFFQRTKEVTKSGVTIPESRKLVLLFEGKKKLPGKTSWKIPLIISSYNFMYINLQTYDL